MLDTGWSSLRFLPLPNKGKRGLEADPVFTVGSQAVSELLPAIGRVSNGEPLNNPGLGSRSDGGALESSDGQSRLRGVLDELASKGGGLRGRGEGRLETESITGIKGGGTESRALCKWLSEGAGRFCLVVRVVPGTLAAERPAKCGDRRIFPLPQRKKKKKGIELH
ncbi:hypothetical protein NDU88_004559 [Pleurodeles waltl]|uniref:Uncharacterized protein n=1 Tax=Pleurodeles waltl TaxID=8319 RepID=A0AAV7VKB4_PLEWA|nr:hypothetical protein NDU88_004559 [Pleurodeles waltl]